MLANRFMSAARKFTTSSAMRSGHGGVPGENLPFDIRSPTKLTAIFLMFFSVPLAAPFLIVRHQMLKK